MAEQVQKTEHGANILETESPRSERIRTLKQLLAAADVDTAVWRVDRWIANKWEVGAKDPDGVLVTHPLWQVKATLVRRRAEMVWPAVQPITVAAKKRVVNEARYRRPQGIETTVVLPDPHFGFRRDLRTNRLVPFHDMRALDVALQVCAALRPHEVVIGGDILDLPDWSDKFLQSPEFQQATQPALLAAHWWMAQLRALLPGSVLRLLEGNHDRRMETAVMRNLAAAYQLRPVDEMNLPPALSVPRLLALHELGILYSDAYPDGEYWLSDDLRIVHGNTVRRGGGKTVAATVRESDVSEIFGHIHRVEQAHKTLPRANGRARVIGHYSPGCLCRIDGTVPGQKARQDWQQGIAVVSTAPGRDAAVQLYRIEDGRLLFGTRLYEGEDRTAVLAQETGWQF